jgi:hypothetical protein
MELPATEQHKKSLEDTFLKKIATIVQVKKNKNLTKLLKVGSAKKIKKHKSNSYRTLFQ